MPDSSMETPPATGERRRRITMALLAVLSIGFGIVVGFTGQALRPVETLSVIPLANQAKSPDAKPLPEVFWLKKGTAKTIGNFRAKERAILGGAPAELNDREIASWVSDAFTATEEPTEDLDARIGAPFVRIGGQLPGTETDPVLTVTTPFKLKILGLPVTEIPLQFVARPQIDGRETVWTIRDMRAGHARIPDLLAERTAVRALNEILARAQNERGVKLLEKLAAYQRVSIRDQKVILEAPVRALAAATR